MEYAKVNEENVVITLPIDLLIFAFENNPENFDDFKVKDKNQFAEDFAKHINFHTANSESGLTVFQQWMDSIFDEIVESGAGYIKFPKDED